MLCFDRGGWSPGLFAHVIAAGFDLLTYRKAAAGKDAPALPDDTFATMAWTGDDGRAHEYDLAESSIELPVTSGEHKGEVLALRQVTRRDKGRQVHISTTCDAAGLPAAAVVYRMTSRWREENYFRYARAHFALDALDSYAVTPDDPQRLVPNPAKKTAAAAVKTAKKALAETEAARQRKLDALRSPVPAPPPWPMRCSPSSMPRSAPPVAASKPPRPPRKPPPRRSRSASTTRDIVRLDAETKLITHAIRMAAYNAETTLARALGGSYARAGDEAYAHPRSPHRQRRHHPRRRHPDHAPRPALCATQNTRHRRPLRPAQRHRHPVPRHPARPALRDQRPPRHCINDLLCQEVLEARVFGIKMNIELTLAEVRAVRNTRPRDPEGTRTIRPNTSPAAIFW